MLRRSCLYPRCRNLAAPGGTYCDPHYLPRARVKDRAHTARRKAAGGNGAARRLRSWVNTQGEACCGRCLQLFAASALDVDHLVPLADGGMDVESNVWPLCKECHISKTRAETSRRAAGTSR